VSRGEFDYNDDLTSRSARAEDMEDGCVKDIEGKGNRSELVLSLLRTIAVSFIPLEGPWPQILCRSME
jgi:hypothetical protein